MANILEIGIGFVVFQCNKMSINTKVMVTKDLSKMAKFAKIFCEHMACLGGKKIDFQIMAQCCVSL